MQTFSKKKIALAVGASLLVMASAAQATAPAAPVARSVPVLVTPSSQGNADSLYGTTGFTGTLPVNVYFTAPADTTSPAIAFAVLSAGGDGLLVNAANNAGTTTGASVATDDIAVYAGTAGASQINLRVPAASVLFTANANTASAANAAFSITVSGTEALRIVAATGQLEYTTDNTAASPTWLPVSVAIQAPSAANAILATDSTAAPNTTPIVAVAGQAAFNTLAPTITVKTRATNGLIDGVVINTTTPLTAAPVVNSPSAALAVTSLIAPASATDFAAVQTAPATGVTTAAVAGTTASYSVVFATPTTVDWTTGNAAADAAVYTAAKFNTGVTNAFAVAATGTAANQAAYSNVYTALGTPAKLAALPAMSDGAAPIVTKAEFASNDIAQTNTLMLTFSEPMALIGFDDMREIAENVFIGSDSLAAINLNNDGNLTKSLSNPAGTGLGELTLTLDTTASSVNSSSTPNLFSGKTVTVTSGIALKETNDTGFSATTPALDSVSLADVSGGTADNAYTAAAQLAGGLKSASGAVEGASVTALATTALAVNVAFNGHGLGGDTTATSQTSVTDATKVSTIRVKFDAGKEIDFAAGKTVADLVGQIRVDVTDADAAGDNPKNWQFFPTAAQMSLDTAGSVLTITIPTELVYQQVATPTGMNVRYLASGETAKVLIKKGATDLTVAANVVDAGNVSVQMPLFATILSDTLYTENIRGAVTDAPNGSLMHGYLAKWIDKEVPGKVGSADVQITSARITIKDDKFAADLALDLSGTIGSSPASTASAANTVPGVTTAAVVATAVVNAFPGSPAAAAAVAAAGIPGNLGTDVVTAVAGYTQGVLETAIMTQLAKDKPELITAWIHVHRSNDAVATATGDSGGPASGTSGVADQRFIDIRAALFSSNPGNSPDKILYEVTIDPVKGTINSPRIVGALKMTSKAVAKLNRGLQFLDAAGNLTPSVSSAVEAQALVGAGGVFNMIVGTDAKTQAQLDNMKDSFQLLVLENPQADTSNGENTFTLLTSADKDASNFVPFSPNLISLKGEVTKLSTPVAPATTAPVETLAKIHFTPWLTDSSNWQLLGFGNLDRKAVLSPTNLPRFMVGLEPISGQPVSFWSGDTADYAGTNWPAYLPATPADMAFTMLGNKSAVASQGTNGDTVGAFTAKPNAVGFAFSDDDPIGVSHKQLFAKALPDEDPTTGLPVGWSLVSVPTAWLTTLPTEIEMIINVGAQLGSNEVYTWSKAELDTAPTLTAYQPVFVFAKTAIAGK